MVVAEHKKIHYYPSTFFYLKNRNFVLVNLLVNKDIIFPKTMGFKSHLYGIEIASL